MSTEKLREKLAEYELKKEELEANDYSTEIEAELTEFKLALERKYADKKAEELSKMEANLFLLNELIAESELEEAAKAEAEAPIPSITDEIVSEVKTVV